MRHRKKTAHQPNNSVSTMNHAAEASRYRTASAGNHRYKTQNLQPSIKQLKMYFIFQHEVTLYLDSPDILTISDFVTTCRLILLTLT